MIFLSNMPLNFRFLYSMTIPNLTVNLSGVFEYGQAYVGELSMLENIHTLPFSNNDTEFSFLSGYSTQQGN